MLPKLGRRFRIVTYDARGHGRSAKPSVGYGFDRTVADARVVARAARLRRPIVAGHSWGAMVALTWAANHPRDVAGAFLVDGGIGALGRERSWAEVREQLAPPHLAGMPLEEFRAMIPRFWDGAIDVTPQVEEIVLSLMRVAPDGTIRPYLRRANHFKILRAIWQHHEPLELHARLRVPATAVLAHAGGEEGRAAWAERRRVVTRALHAVGAPTTIAGIEGIHDLPLQHPDAVARRLERWARTAVR